MTGTLGDLGHNEMDAFTPQYEVGVRLCREAGLDAIALVTVLVQSGQMPAAARERADEILRHYNEGLAIREKAYNNRELVVGQRKQA
jgi:hypothetical protein